MRIWVGPKLDPIENEMIRIIIIFNSISGYFITSY